MRLRLPELLRERGLTGYRIAKASGGRLSLSAVYALLRRQGRFEKVKSDHLDALCDVLGVDAGELLTRDTRADEPKVFDTLRTTRKPNRV